MNADFTTILTQSIESSTRPSSASLVTALQQAETAARKDKLIIPFDELLGEWRLAFATGANKSKSTNKPDKGFYLPKFTPASIAFTREDDSSITATVTNQLEVGLVRFKFTGPCRYLEKKNIIVFDFTEIYFYLIRQKIYQTKIRSGKDNVPSFEELSIDKNGADTIANLPFFSFFWTSPNGIAARGRGGGLALWTKQ